MRILLGCRLEQLPRVHPFWVRDSLPDHPSSQWVPGQKLRVKYDREGTCNAAKEVVAHASTVPTYWNSSFDEGRIAFIINIRSGKIFAVSHQAIMKMSICQ